MTKTLRVEARDQLQQAERLLETLEGLASLPEGENVYEYEPYQDAAENFFIACWSIRDAIVEDRLLSEPDKRALDKRINLSRELRACADLANRAKHHRLNRPPRSKPFSAAGHHFLTDFGTRTIEWMIDLDSGMSVIEGKSLEESMRASENDLVGARELGWYCLAEWRHIFQELGLPLPRPKMPNPFLAR